MDTQIINVFYVWATDDEGGYGICNKSKFMDIIHKYTSISMHIDYIFDFIDKDDFITKFITNNFGDKKDAEFWYSTLLT